MSLGSLTFCLLGQHLADADAMLWQIQPDPLPERAEADRVSLGSSSPADFC